MPALSINDYGQIVGVDDTVWVWKGIIPVGGSTLFYGSPKVGKSFLSLGLCEAIADPTIPSYLNLPIQQHGRVLYVQLDTPRSLWWTGYLTLVQSAKARQGVFTIDREMADLPKGFDIKNVACAEWLRSEVDKVQPVLVIVDTLRRMFVGDENDSSIMTHVHDMFIQATQPAALLYVAHRKKPQQGDTGHGSARGSSALIGAVDALVNMAKTALYIEARSDAPEEIPIVQADNGSWSIDNEQDLKIEFMSKLPAELPKMAKYKAIMEEFKVSMSTAQRYAKNLK